MGTPQQLSLEKKTGFFWTAIEQCNLPAVKDYLRDPQAGQLIHAQDAKTGGTPLHDAIKRAVNTLGVWDDRLEIVKVIINHPDPDLTTQDKSGRTALDFAVDTRAILDAGDAKQIAGGVSTKRSRELERRAGIITQLLIARNLKLNLADSNVNGRLRTGLKLIDKGLGAITKSINVRLQYYQAKGDLDGVTAMLQLSQNINMLTLTTLSNHAEITPDFKKFVISNAVMVMSQSKQYIPPSSQLYKMVISFVALLAVGAFLGGLNFAPDFGAVSWASGESNIANGIGAAVATLCAGLTYVNAAPVSAFQLRGGIDTLSKGCFAVYDKSAAIVSPAVNVTKLPDPHDTPGYSPS